MLADGLHRVDACAEAWPFADERPRFEAFDDFAYQGGPKVLGDSPDGVALGH